MAKREYFWGIYRVQSILAASLLRNRSSCATHLSNGRPGREVSAMTVVSNTIGPRAYPTNNALGLRLFSSTSNKPCTKLEQPLPATTSRQTISTWVRWIFGSLLSILIPFWTHKYWRNLQMIEGEAEVVMEEVDNVAKDVERVATVAEKVSADVAEKLPTHTKLKQIALLIERVSELAAQDAQLTQQFIHKVDALKEDLEDLEKLVKPAVNKIENYEFQGNYSPAQLKEQN
ncbi:PREDICTED: uncharacterized protein LOC101310960 [Fragaria vesca subsp. vesca]|uniref:uncharacterized protein LOC101310960 n=1 Tax=Fragaria vesca subsp. vesca TaxID=101020 RepID=UPI0002C36940|nr:PREDICTED: uncharacterized protein LOC101310960 [Fragaria vesca subsp. vesca]